MGRSQLGLRPFFIRSLAGARAKNTTLFHSFITYFILKSVFLQPLKSEVEYIDVQGI